MTSSNQQSSFKYLDIISSLFAVILVVSNIASSAKIVDMGFSLFSVRMAFDGGTLLFPLAYVLGDVLTEVYGFKTSRRVIWTGFAALILSSLALFVLRTLPPEAAWEAETGSVAYNAVLGGMSSGGIVLASLAAYLAGELSNSMLLSKLKVLMKGRLLWVRAVGSSLIGELLDSLIFISVATAAGVFPRELFWPLVLTNYFLKCTIEVLILPLTYAAVRFLKRKEGVDVYDEGEKYRPF
jgi:uncharacterized integral membrane protein (TIGR00697 family)